jgi:transposase
MFSGKRVKRGLYRTSNDVLVNADINAALNIMRKSNAVDIKILCARGEVDTPVRIRVA